MDNELTNEVGTRTTSATCADSAEATSELGIVDELLIEEISIDGMCGVY